jgi:hypothetical protein
VSLSLSSLSGNGPGRVKIAQLGAHRRVFAAAERQIRWNRPSVISAATRSFM